MPSKPPAIPFKSGVFDYDALYKRINEIGITGPVGNKNGVDITPQPEPPKETPKADYSYY